MKESSTPAREEFEVALSFAGEDREYVETVAHYLRVKGVSSFYDRFEEDRLWGEDLYVHLDDIYRKASHFCIMFISEAYAAKSWTNHERKSAQARDFINNNETFILPARFDDTEIKGLRPTIGYVDLRDKSPYEFAELVALKVRGRRNQLLRKAFADALTLADKYLQPNSLVTSDAIAESIRNAFRKTGFSPDLNLLEPYLTSSSPAERTVGYVAYQTGPHMMVGNMLYATLQVEVEYAGTSKETRPLWQLLVAIALFATVTNPEEIQFMQFDLSPVLSRLEQLPGVDVGGQCKTKLRGLADVYPWMRGDDGYWGNNWLDGETRHFKWSNGDSTYSYEDALRFVRSYPAVAQEHISSGHFENWYSISVPRSATALDLAFSLAQEMVRKLKNDAQAGKGA